VATKPLAIVAEVIEPPPPPHEAIDSAPKSAAVELRMDAQERMKASAIGSANADGIGYSVNAVRRAIGSIWLEHAN
jgi:hypothetical protein